MPTFSFSSSEEEATFTCSVDGSSQPCSSPYTVPIPLADGSHEFKVTATNPLNIVIGHAVDFFSVETTPPIVKFVDRPMPTTSDRTPIFSFTSSEEPSTFTCSVDGSSQPCSSPYTVPTPLADGSHEFKVTATDPLGNVGHAVDFFSVETTPPIVKFVDRPMPTTSDRTPIFSFTSSEEPSTFTCSVDGSSQPCSSPYTVPTPLADGSHEFKVTATDPLGNVGHAVDFFSVDTKRPDTFITEHPPKLIRTHQRKARAIFRFGSNESGVTFACRVDRGIFHFCNAKLSRRFPVGRAPLRVKARNAAGNVDPTPAIFRFRVKRVG